MSNVPDIRFKGFTDAWEQRKLGDISRMYQPLTITGNDLLPDGVPVFGANGFIGFFSEANHIDDQVTISARGEGTGTPSYVHGPVWITGNSMVVNVGDFDIDKYFLFANLTTNSLKKYVTGGAQPQLTRDVLVKVPITLPNTDEQQKIGSFFKQLDNTIALLQRELDSLKLIKDSLLQKLFPAINEQNPCIRLNNFKEDWKSVKLADISNRVTRKNKELESTTPLTISALYGLVDQTKYFSKQIASEKLENYILIKKGEFAYNKSYSNGYPFGAVKRLDNYDKGVLSSLYIVFKLLSVVDSNFMKYYFETKLWHKEVQKKSAEGARNHGLLNITTTDFLSLKIKMPNDINEQTKIGEYLNSLDSKIDKLNREIILYQKMKKGFLQKLFPKGE
ncbi:restriction endonuclease subunit S [Macrococcoides canis]|uniref:restriction endonuclease subunit S n=1 Tax=Macrococcoides canis TaxID=1855823 RepID=UPI00106151D7|nr:restriction endonuclease subunit S [Macrococcus canis]TDM30211.1 restriction endonuclease subunit S [Macrococcus canis]